MDRISFKEISNMDSLLQRNDYFSEQFLQNPLMQLIVSEHMNDRLKRHRLLDVIQTFSDYFQKVVMLRSVLCENQRFISIAQAHLSKEFELNMQLMQDRQHRPRVWDPILESGSTWFAWKMLALDNEEKILLVHLVLETSTSIFFQAAHRVMQAYSETEYFTVHAIANDEQDHIGVELLGNLSTDRYQDMIELQQQGWRILNMVCERMADIILGVDTL
jgi:hypothetical protein